MIEFKIMFTCLRSVAIYLVLLPSVSGLAQVQYGVPKEAQAIGVDPMIGDRFPTNLTFVNSKGENVELSKIIDDKVPVFVTLNYSNCPGLCIAQLGNLVKTINEVEGLTLGKDFRMISISIDPSETNERLATTKERYTSLLDDRHSADGWHFLRGSQASINAVAKSTGFRYKYDPVSGQFSHAAVAIGVSPNGVITRYLYDLALDGATMRLALIETSQGKLGTIGDQLLLWCYHFDSEANQYTATARRIMSIGAGLFVILGLAVSLPFWLTRRRFPKSHNAADLDSIDPKLVKPESDRTV